MSSDDNQIAKTAIIKHENMSLIDGFANHLKDSGLSPKTVRNHVDNLHFFADYLVYYEPYEKLSDADAGDVSSFLSDYFPRKSMWASPFSVKSYIATFKKFFNFMLINSLIKEAGYKELLETIKLEKELWLDSVDSDDEGFW